MRRSSPIHDSFAGIPHKPRIGPRTPPGSPPKTPESDKADFDSSLQMIHNPRTDFRSPTSPFRMSISSECLHPRIRSSSPYSPSRVSISPEYDENAFNPYSQMLHDADRSRTLSSPSKVSISSEHKEDDQNRYSEMIPNPHIKSETPSSPSRISINSKHNEGGQNPYSQMIYNPRTDFRSPTSPFRMSISSECLHPRIRSSSPYSPSRVSISPEYDENAFNPYSQMLHDADRSRTLSSPSKVSISSEHKEDDQNRYSEMIPNPYIKSETPSSPSRISINSKHNEGGQNPYSQMIHNANRSRTLSSPLKVSISSEHNGDHQNPYVRMIQNCQIKSEPPSSSSRVSISTKYNEGNNNPYSRMLHGANRSNTPSSSAKVSISSEHKEVDQNRYSEMIPDPYIKSEPPSNPSNNSKNSDRDEVDDNPYSRMLHDANRSKKPSSVAQALIDFEKELNDELRYSQMIPDPYIKSEPPSSPSNNSKNSDRDEVDDNPYSRMLHDANRSKKPSSAAQALIDYEKELNDELRYSQMIPDPYIKSEPPSSPSNNSKNSDRDEVDDNPYSRILHDANRSKKPSSAAQALIDYEKELNDELRCSQMIPDPYIKSEPPSSPSNNSKNSDRDEVDDNPYSRMINSSRIKSKTSSSPSRVSISSGSEEVDHNSYPKTVPNPHIRSSTLSSPSSATISSESSNFKLISYPQIRNRCLIQSRRATNSFRVSISSERDEVNRDSHPRMSQNRRYRTRSPSNRSSRSRSSERTKKFKRYSPPRVSRRNHRRAISPNRRVILHESRRTSRDRHRSLNRYNNDQSNNRRSPVRWLRRSRSPPRSYRRFERVEAMSRRERERESPESPRSRNFSTDHDHYSHRLYHRPHLSDNVFDQPPLNPSSLVLHTSTVVCTPSTQPYFGPIHPTFGPRQIVPPYYSLYPLQNTNDRYPDYLSHIRPEDDPLATRTLFVGNLEISISIEHLRLVFGTYGIVEHIDLKIPSPSTGNAYAFVRYTNLDMAYAAKVQLSGQFLGKLPCKIGYGKRIPTQQVWVGGLGTWTSPMKLKQEFRRFGVIKDLQYTKGETCAYIKFETINAAIAAVNEMRGVYLKDSLHKLKTDFAEEEVRITSKPKSTNDNLYVIDSHSSTSDYREQFETGEKCEDTTNHSSLLKHSDSVIDLTGGSGNPSVSLQKLNSNNLDTKADSSDSSRLTLTLNNLVEGCINVWQGSFLLKKEEYPVTCHLLYGDPKIVEKMEKSNDGKYILRIDQQLHLIKLNTNEPKEIYDFITTTENKSVLLAMPRTASTDANEDEGGPSRSLNCLINYLTLNTATDVVPLLKDKDPSGGVYIFPPSDYSITLMKDVALKWQKITGEYLVVVLITKSNDDTSDN